MTDHIAIIRLALIDLKRSTEGMTGFPVCIPALVSLITLEAELKRLRDDPNRLDFTGAPSVFVWQLFGLADGNTMAKVGIHGKETEAISDTPRAALTAAIKRLKL